MFICKNMIQYKNGGEITGILVATQQRKYIHEINLWILNIIINWENANLKHNGYHFISPIKEPDNIKYGEYID